MDSVNVAERLEGVKSKVVVGAPEPSEFFKGAHCDLRVVLRGGSGGSDVIYQFFSHSKAWPKDEARGRVVLSKLISSYFGSTEFFRAEWIPELSSWAVLAEGFRTRNIFNPRLHALDFAEHLNRELAALERP